MRIGDMATFRMAKVRESHTHGHGSTNAIHPQATVSHRVAQAGVLSDTVYLDTRGFAGIMIGQR